MSERDGGKMVAVRRRGCTTRPPDLHAVNVFSGPGLSRETGTASCLVGMRPHSVQLRYSTYTGTIPVQSY
jgi:hypothetical protein